MAFPSRRSEKQIRVATFDNEPLARLAVQRLQEMGIPALTRCLRGGPGLWGSGYNLPHDLVVYESEQGQAPEGLARGPSRIPGAASPTGGASGSRGGGGRRGWAIGSSEWETICS